MNSESFYGCKKQKAWNKTREKYMLIKRRHKFSCNRQGIILQRGTIRRIFRQQRCILQW